MEVVVRRNLNDAEVFIVQGTGGPDAASERERLLALVEEGATTLTVDISGLEYFDGEWLALLVSTRRHCVRKGGEMTITGLRGSVKELFELSHLDLMFRIRK